MQAAQLVDVLKKALRDRGLTYARLARGLDLSESSVKRLFSTRRMSLERLEQICAHLELEVSDLLELARASEPRLQQLSEEQEAALVGDPKLLLVGLLTLSHWSAAEINAAYQLTEAEVVAHLARLDKLGILDLLPGNRIKLRIARDFTWRRHGPLQRFFEERVQDEFFGASFTARGELRLLVHGSLSSRSNELLRGRMRKLVEDFDALAEEDRRLDHKTLAGTSMVLAIRPWELKAFTALRRI